MNGVVSKTKKIFSIITEKRHIFALPFVSTALLSAVFLLPSLNWLVFVALVPLLYFIEQVKNRGLSFKKSVVFIWLSGFYFFTEPNMDGCN